MQVQPNCTADNGKNKPICLTQRIGQTTYKVNVHFSETSKETIGDKIIRIIENEAANQ